MARFVVEGRGNWGIRRLANTDNPINPPFNLAKDRSFALLVGVRIR